MDRTQIVAFVDLMVGWTSLGVDSNGEEVAVPTSPQLKTFVVARLGNAAPRHGDEAIRDRARGAALASLLREVADGLEPKDAAIAKATGEAG